jgi:hypothetical protein
LLAVFAKPAEIPLSNQRGDRIGMYLLSSLCAVIEVKNHRYDSVDLRAGTLCVLYDDKEKNVTEQNKDQMHALRGFLKRPGTDPPHVTRFIWLRNVYQSELQERSADGTLPHDILVKDSTWANVLTSIWQEWRGKHPTDRGFDDGKYFISANIRRDAPADFNLISLLLTNEEMALRPFSYADLQNYRVAPSGSRKTDSIPFDTHQNPPRSGSAQRRALTLMALLFLLGVAAALSLPKLIALHKSRMQVASTRNEQDLDRDLLTSYAGRYMCQDKWVKYLITIAARDSGLYASLSSAGGGLRPIAKDEFMAVDFTNGFQGRVRFVRSSKGEGLTLLLIPDKGPRVGCARLD